MYQRLRHDLRFLRRRPSPAPTRSGQQLNTPESTLRFVSIFVHKDDIKPDASRPPKSAALQYAKDQIRVNSVHPRFVDTPLARPGLVGDAGASRMAATPLARFGKPSDIAFACLYLASDEAAWMTGSELVIDGGMTAN
jgi:hypothetical protein